MVQIQSLLNCEFSSLSIPYPGEALDPGREFSPLSQMYTVQAHGTTRSIYSLVYALLCALFVQLFGLWGYYLPSLFAGSVLLLLSLPLARSLGAKRLAAVPLVVGFATPLLFYSLSFWEHALCALLAMAAVVLAARYHASERWPPLAVAGVLCGLVGLVRFEAMLLGPALVIALLLTGADRLRAATVAAGTWLAGATVPLLLNFHLYGHPLGGAVQLNFAGAAPRFVPAALWAELGSRLQIAAALLVDRGAGRWVLAAACAVLISALLSLRCRRQLLLTVVVAACAGWFLVAGRGFFVYTGLLASCPLVVLAVHRPRRCHQLRILLLLWGLGYCILVALGAPNDGGAQWGPRYLLPIIPPLAVLAWSAFEDTIDGSRKHLWVAVTGTGLCVVFSFLLQLHSVRVMRHSLRHMETIIEAAREPGNQIVLSDTWWTPQVLAPLYFDHQLYFAAAKSRVEGFIELLRSNAVQGFTFASSRTWGDEASQLRSFGAECVVEGQFPGSFRVYDCTVLARPQSDRGAVFER